MKYLSRLILIPLLLSPLFVHAETLAPSLTVQMRQQEQIDHTNYVTQRKQSLIEAQAAIRARVLARKQAIQEKIAKRKIVSSTTTTTMAQTKTTTTPNPEIPSTPQNLESRQSIPGVDLDRVRSTWLAWNNELRKSMNLTPYTYSTRLEQTAYDWNTVFEASRGSDSHERTKGDGYYNYQKIADWFSTRGVTAKNIHGITLTENVGYGSYSCSQSDCTDALIRSIRSTYDFYLREKPANGPHYRSLVNGEFRQIGIAISVVPSDHRYYITVHYITDFQEK